MRRLTTTSLVLATLIVTACGGDDDAGGSGLGSAEQALADAIANSMMEDQDDDLPMTQDEAECFSEGVVSTIGLDTLVELGLSEQAVEAGTTPDEVDLPDGVVDDFVDVMMGCVDLAAIMAAGMTEDGEVSEESAKCLADGILEDYENFVLEGAKSGITGEEFDPSQDADLIAGIFGLMAECLSEDEFNSIMGS